MYERDDKRPHNKLTNCQWAPNKPPLHHGHSIRPTMQAAPRIAVCTVQADEALSIGYRGTDCIPGLEKRAISICGGQLHRLQHSTLSSTRLKNISSFPSLDGGLGFDPAFSCVLPMQTSRPDPPMSFSSAPAHPGSKCLRL